MDYVKEAENYLYYYRDNKRSIKFMRREIERLAWKNAPKDTRGLDYSKEKVSSSCYDDTIDNLFTIASYNTRIQDTQAEIDIIDYLLDHMEQEEQGYGKILKLWYIEQINREHIAVEMGYNETHIYRIRDKAIRKFAVNLFGIDVVKSIIGNQDEAKTERGKYDKSGYNIDKYRNNRIEDNTYETQIIGNN